MFYFSRKQVTLRNTHHKPRFISATKWSPVDSSLVIVDNYNIFYIPTVAKPNYAKQITFHGSEDLYHGIPDWVYRGNKDLFNTRDYVNIPYGSQFYTCQKKNVLRQNSD